MKLFVDLSSARRRSVPALFPTFIALAPADSANNRCHHPGGTACGHIFSPKVGALSIWPFVSPRKYATMPSFVRAVYRRCLPNKSLYRSLCLCSCAERGTNPPMIRLVGNETTVLPLRCAIQRGIKLAVMVMQSIRGKHVQVEGAPSCPFVRNAQLVFRLA